MHLRYYRIYIPVMILLLFGQGSHAQGTTFGLLIEHVDNLVSEMPGSSGNQYQNPSPQDIADFKMVIALIQAGDLAEANTLAASLEYEVIRFIDHTLANNQEFIILQKQPGGSNFWGTLIYNSGACRKVALQCPHPRLDSNTGVQGAYIFTRLNARFIMLSGTHRCNSTSASTCSGSTSVCGSSAKYRISDVAHNDKSMFQEMTRALAITNPDLVFIQLHGFTRLSGDPHLIMSNGTRDTPATDPIGALRQSLQALDPGLTFRIAHVDTDWTRLIGFTNTQGRFLNQSPDACSADASDSEGRFAHIEQEFDSFRADETGWDLMYQGLEEAFACWPVATRDISLAEFHLSGRQISFDFAVQQSHLLELYSYDGRCLRRTAVQPGTWYELPPNTLLVVILRSVSNGTPVFSRKFYFTE